MRELSLRRISYLYRFPTRPPTHPAPASGPVNFFIDPIVEIDGETAEDHVKNTFTFHDLEMGD